MAVKRYIAIPEEVSGVRMEGGNAEEVANFAGCAEYSIEKRNGAATLTLVLGEGVRIRVVEGDYVLKEKRGIQVVKEKIFSEKYVEKK